MPCMKRIAGIYAIVLAGALAHAGFATADQPVGVSAIQLPKKTDRDFRKKKIGSESKKSARAKALAEDTGEKN